MDSHLQLLGSIVIGGIFLLGLLTFHGGVMAYFHRSGFELVTQETMSSLTEVVEHDFRHMGGGLVTPALAIVAYDTTDITFLGDIDVDGDVDTVRYYVSAPSAAAAAATPNPNDIILFRIVNGGETIGDPAGVTDFRVDLLDERGDPTDDRWAVRSLRLRLRFESLYPYDGQYVPVFWERRITPMNLYRPTLTDF